MLGSAFGAGSTSKYPTVIQTAYTPDRFVTRLPNRDIGSYIMYGLRLVSANDWSRASLKRGSESRAALSLGIAPFVGRTDTLSLAPKPASRASPNCVGDG